MPPQLQVYHVPLHLLQPAPWNITKPSKRSLNLLISNIREVGFIETAVVVPKTTGASFVTEGNHVTSGEFRILSGHDKVLAATQVGMTEIPCFILPDTTSEETQKLLTVRMNTIKKKLDPQTFMKLYYDLASNKAEETVKSQMMFSNEEELESLLKRDIAVQRQALPTEELKEALDAQKPKIKSVEDLANVVQELASRTGSTNLDKGYAIFTYGGQESIYVAMDKELREKIHKLVDRASVENRHISEIFNETMQQESKP